MRATKIFLLLVLTLVIIPAYLNIGAQAKDNHKISYAKCLKKFKTAAQIKAGGSAGAKAEFSMIFKYALLGTITVHVSSLSEGPKVGHAKATIVIAVDDDSLIWDIICSPQASYENRSFNSEAFAKKIERADYAFSGADYKTENNKSTEYNPNMRVTTSERHAMINTVRRTMEPCWNFQAGPKKMQDIIVEIEVTLRPDGYVTSANITNRSELETDPFKLAAGESALRAVLNPSCQPYKLPTDKYEVWKDIKLKFNPREMMGR
jgi:hypothetical protein